MSVPLVDLHVKFLIDHILRTVRDDPNKHVTEIFGDAKIDPHAALYGQKMIDDVKEWITTTNIPVLLAFDLDPTQIPGITVHLESSSPEQQYMGDRGLTFTKDLKPEEKEVIVPKFVPDDLAPDVDGTFVTVTLPDTLSEDQQNLILPGLKWRDKNGKEYGIGEDKTDPTIVRLENGATLSQGDFSELEVIAPFDNALFQEGSMYFNESSLITIHGHADRSEGLWLWAIVQWGILKFRPLLTATFGLDLAIPRASDFSKDDNFLGDNIWRRFITLGAKAVWSWEAARQKDITSFVLSVRASQRQLAGEPEPEPTDLC